MGLPNATNLIVGGAALYYAPVGTVTPADTVDYGVAWTAPWARLGLTKAPVVFKYEQEVADHQVEEALAAVRRTIIGESVTVETVLAELTPEYLAIGSGRPTSEVTTTVSGVATAGTDAITLGGHAAPVELAIGMEGMYVTAAGVKLPLRVFLHRTTITMGGDLQFSWRANDYPGIPILIRGMADVSKSVGNQLFKMVRVTAAET